jgi:hypothetical protein
VQDPVWEQSFPDVAGVVFPFADPESGRTVPAALSPSEVEARRLANEGRRRELVRGLRGLDLEPVLVDSSDLYDVFRAFVGWVERRRSARGRR